MKTEKNKEGYDNSCLVCGTPIWKNSDSEAFDDEELTTEHLHECKKCNKKFFYEVDYIKHINSEHIVAGD